MLVEELIDLLCHMPATAHVDVRLSELRRRNDITDVRYTDGQVLLVIEGDERSKPYSREQIEATLDT